jgi:hypothetical protein
MVKRIVLTAIYYKGIEQVKKEAATLAESALTTKSYIMSIIKKVEQGQIKIVK